MSKTKRTINDVPLVSSPHFKTPYNATRFSSDDEENSGELVTVPDQTMSVSEIVNRFAQGLPLGGAKVEMYDGEDDVLEGINFQTLDIHERYEILEARKQELIDLQNKYDEMAKAQARQYQIDKAVNKKLASIKDEERDKAQRAEPVRRTPETGKEQHDAG